jgi:hypothetical protein
MSSDSCSLSENCECPLCPLPTDFNQVWYSEDEICKNPEFEAITRSMKKLKRKAAQGYFTLEMLNRDFIVRNGTEGIDPDLPDSVRDPWKEYQRREKTWLRKHLEITKERREAMRALGLKSIQSIQKPLSHPSISELVDSKGVIVRLDPPFPLKSIENGGSER